MPGSSRTQRRRGTQSRGCARDRR